MAARITILVLLLLLIPSRRALAEPFRAGTAARSCFESVIPQVVAVCQETNAEREKVGAGALEYSDALSREAQTFAADMNVRGYFSHLTPENQTMRMRLDETGVPYTIGGENIARYYPSGAGAMYGWMNSPPHRRNILNPEFRKIGIGAAGEVYVQIFTD